MAHALDILILKNILKPALKLIKTKLKRNIFNNKLNTLESNQTEYKKKSQKKTKYKYKAIYSFTVISMFFFM